jgi:hypothetical protein
MVLGPSLRCATCRVRPGPHLLPPRGAPSQDTPPPSPFIFSAEPNRTAKATALTFFEPCAIATLVLQLPLLSSFASAMSSCSSEPRPSATSSAHRRYLTPSRLHRPHAAPLPRWVSTVASSPSGWIPLRWCSPRQPSHVPSTGGPPTSLPPCGRVRGDPR